jgi:Flp pilus assembly pilin Flp
MCCLVERFLREEDGQDVIEYALLSAFVGVIGVLAWQNVGTRLGALYVGWDSGVQTLSTCTPDPIAFGGGCP